MPNFASGLRLQPASLKPKNFKNMKQFDFRNASPAETVAWSIKHFSDLRKEFADYLAAPMLVACNSVVVVNHDNALTIGVNSETHTTQLVHGDAFPTTFTPETAARICREAACTGADGKPVSMEVKNIAVYLREQIALFDSTIEMLKKSPYYTA